MCVCVWVCVARARHARRRSRRVGRDAVEGDDRHASAGEHGELLRADNRGVVRLYVLRIYSLAHAHAHARACMRACEPTTEEPVSHSTSKAVTGMPFALLIGCGSDSRTTLELRATRVGAPAGCSGSVGAVVKLTDSDHSDFPTELMPRMRKACILRHGPGPCVATRTHTGNTQRPRGAHTELTDAHGMCVWYAHGMHTACRRHTRGRSEVRDVEGRVAVVVAHVIERARSRDVTRRRIVPLRGEPLRMLYLNLADG